MKLLHKSRMGQKTLNLTAIQKTIFHLPIIIRLNAKMVSCPKQFLGLFVPNSKGKHPSQAIQNPRPIFLISMNNDFRIAMGSKCMPFLQQLFPQFPKIINFSVENQHQRLILVKNRLCAAFQVNNTQTSKAQCRLLVHIDFMRIRATVENFIQHLPHHPVFIATFTCKSHKSTHSYFSFQGQSPQ